MPIFCKRYPAHIFNSPSNRGYYRKYIKLPNLSFFLDTFWSEAFLLALSKCRVFMLIRLLDWETLCKLTRRKVTSFKSYVLRKSSLVYFKFDLKNSLFEIFNGWLHRLVISSVFFSKTIEKSSLFLLRLFICVNIWNAKILKIPFRFVRYKKAIGLLPAITCQPNVLAFSWL